MSWPSLAHLIHASGEAGRGLCMVLHGYLAPKTSTRQACCYCSCSVVLPLFHSNSNFSKTITTKLTLVLCSRGWTKLLRVKAALLKFTRTHSLLTYMVYNNAGRKSDTKYDSVSPRRTRSYTVDYERWQMPLTHHHTPPCSKPDTFIK